MYNEYMFYLTGLLYFLVQIYTISILLFSDFASPEYFTFIPHQSWAQGYKKIFMLNSAEHEILNAYKYKNFEQISIFSVIET